MKYELNIDIDSITTIILEDSAALSFICKNRRNIYSFIHIHTNTSD